MKILAARRQESLRDTIKARLREIISSDVVDWGISVKSVEIQDIQHRTVWRQDFNDRDRPDKSRSLRGDSTP